MWGPVEPREPGGPETISPLLQSLKNLGPGTLCVCVCVCVYGMVCLYIYVSVL